MAAFPTEVKIVEVGARDGLQNEKSVTAADKISLINALSDAGLKNIEAGAFVSPKWVPQMADSAEVITTLNLPHGNLSALTPNLKGAQAAHAHVARQRAPPSATAQASSALRRACPLAC